MTGPTDQYREKDMNAIHTILAVTAKSWNLRPASCANQAQFKAACTA